MALAVRPKVYSLPSYSLTGDLLGFLRCGLQYRYTRVGKLPSSRPVQLWFGEFIHGVMEEAYRRYDESQKRGVPSVPPWPEAELKSIRDLIEARLAARGLVPWDDELERIGRERADTAVNELGPHLFPLIHRAEVRLTGARSLPAIAPALQFREADRYEMVGVIDVVTHVQLHDPRFAANPIVRAILKTLPERPGDRFEVIIDYKGMRRPPYEGGAGPIGLWTQYAWQLMTYAEIRRHQPDALPVAAGVLVYINELHPTRSDLETLKREVTGARTDVLPVASSAAADILRRWGTKDPLPGTERSMLPPLPFEYRLERALRIVPVTQDAIRAALSAFDGVVERIETCLGKECHGQPILKAWERNATDENTCVVCDSRTYCPDYQTQYAGRHGEKQPRLPGVRVRA